MGTDPKDKLRREPPRTVVPEPEFTPAKGGKGGKGGKIAQENAPAPDPELEAAADATSHIPLPHAAGPQPLPGRDAVEEPKEPEEPTDGE